nr:sulfatase-like hydrolase/transferase [Allomuricauda sp.]
MKSLLILVFSIAIYPMGYGQKTGKKAADSRPNIILIMADDMGYECLGSNGSTSYNTPVLDKMAEQGVRFTNAYSQPLCTPSRVKIMTGKYNYRNYIDFGYLDPNEKTFGNMLQDAGYKTLIAGKWQLNGRDGKEPGYEDKQRPYHFGFDEYCLWQIAEKGTRYANPVIEENGKRLETTIDDYGPDIVSDYIIDFIDRNHQSPFFVYYPMILVHSPFNPTPDSPEWKNPERRLENDTQYFKDMVEYTDKIVGKIMDQLKSKGIAENTILIFTGDNGTHTAITSYTEDGAYKGGKGSLKDNGSHVPLVAQWPAEGQQNIVTDNLIEFSDFVPTLAQAAGLSIPEDTDGQSFLNILNEERYKPRKNVFVHYYPRTRQVNKNYGCFTRTVDYKLYSDGRFFEMFTDKWEENPLDISKLSKKQEKEYRKLKKELSDKDIWNFDEVHRKTK